MKTPTYVAISRQSALTHELTTVANNISNASTDGYRGDHTLFQEFLKHTGEPGKRDKISFVQDSGQYRDIRDGKLQQTGAPLDAAIQGNGYFIIGNPGEQLYSRLGNFRVDSSNRIVTAAGYPVLQSDGTAITLPQDVQPAQVTIAGDGTVWAQTYSNGVVDSGRDNPLGKLALVKFADDQKLREAGSGFYATDQAPQPVAANEGTIVQGALEGSNVEPVMEVTRMITIMRDYQAIQNMIDQEDTRQRNAADKIVQNV
jgi:flagellar basal-body rod protein FlgF